MDGLWERDQLDSTIAEVAGGSFARREPPEIVGSAYVVKTLEAALWAFSRSSDFREGALLAVNLGDDADTTAAIYGQVAGACYGGGRHTAGVARAARNGGHHHRDGRRVVRGVRAGGLTVGGPASRSPFKSSA